MAIKRLQLRRDTAANWSSTNPILLQGEMGVEYDTGRFKVGTGFAPWNDLSYSSGPAGPQGIPGEMGVSGAAGNNGTNGQGVPVGGATDTVLKKVSGTNYDTTWVAQNTLTAGNTTNVDGKRVYIQTTDPGAVGAGAIWIQTV
jgi:hypothetical protein